MRMRIWTQSTSNLRPMSIVTDAIVFTVPSYCTLAHDISSYDLLFNRQYKTVNITEGGRNWDLTIF